MSTAIATTAASSSSNVGALQLSKAQIEAVKKMRKELPQSEKDEGVVSMRSGARLKFMVVALELTNYYKGLADKERANDPSAPPVDFNTRKMDEMQMRLLFVFPETEAEIKAFNDENAGGADGEPMAQITVDEEATQKHGRTMYCLRVAARVAKGTAELAAKRDAQLNMMRAASIEAFKKANAEEFAAMSDEEKDKRFGAENRVTKSIRTSRVIREMQQVTVRMPSSAEKVTNSAALRTLQPLDEVEFTGFSFCNFLSEKHKEALGVTMKTDAASVKVTRRVTLESRTRIFEMILSKYGGVDMNSLVTLFGREGSLPCTWFESYYDMRSSLHPQILAYEKDRSRPFPREAYAETVYGETPQLGPQQKFILPVYWRRDQCMFECAKVNGMAAYANAEGWSKNTKKGAVRAVDLNITATQFRKRVDDNATTDAVPVYGPDVSKEGFTFGVRGVAWDESIDAWCPVRNAAMWSSVAPVLMTSGMAFLEFRIDYGKSELCAENSEEAEMVFRLATADRTMERFRKPMFFFHVKFTSFLVDMVRLVRENCVPITAAEAAYWMKRTVKYEQLKEGTTIGEYKQRYDVHPCGDLSTKSIIALNELNPDKESYEKYLTDDVVKKTFDGPSGKCRRYSFFAVPAANSVNDSHREVFSVLASAYVTEADDESYTRSMAGGLLEDSYKKSDLTLVDNEPHASVLANGLERVARDANGTYVLVVDNLAHAARTDEESLQESFFYRMQRRRFMSLIEEYGAADPAAKQARVAGDGGGGDNDDDDDDDDAQ